MLSTAIVAETTSRCKGGGWTVGELLAEHRAVVSYLAELAELVAAGEDVTDRYARANDFADELAAQIAERSGDRGNAE